MKRSLLGLLAGYVFLMTAIIFLYSAYSSVKNGLKTVGHVVDTKQDDTPGDEDLFAPIIEFKTPDGKTHVFTSKVYSKPEPEIGSELPIYYNPSAPEDAVVNEPFVMFFIPGFLACLGIFFLVIFGKPFLQKKTVE